MSKTTADLKQEVTKSLDLLRTLRDEVRVRLHLGGMDIKSEWDKLEPHLHDVEKRAVELSDASRVALTDALKSLKKLRASLSDGR